MEVYIPGQVTLINCLASHVKLFEIELKESFSVRPGQFIMLWIPRIGEIPLSVTDMEGSVLKLIIARKGKVTTFIHENIRVGSRVYVRGPFGNGFTLKKWKALLIGGGYGLAPLYFLAKSLNFLGYPCDVALGFKNRNEVFFEEEFKKICSRVIIYTDDGSYGLKGMVTDILRGKDVAKTYDAIYACGKEAMIVKLLQYCLRHGLYMEASLERYIKCGVGVCGSCILDGGIRVCRDGPVFNSSILRELKDLGKVWRDPSGRKQPLP
ncbi:MAG: dihydroorotate dehydrogenase electron transfer subunit [Thermoprotei archaeon]|nr:MAG: dihydroorotate dehydrogenase electron transfer subunit [Thermoprotei archaeon]